jgi:propanol-preferring alcohol dehydrogenase
MLPTTQQLDGIAAVSTQPYGLPYIFEKQDPTHPFEGETLVRLDYSGVCHGDVYMRDGGGPAPPTPRRPLIGGHEGVGTVIELGSGNHGVFHVGHRVGVAWRSYVCGGYQACRAGSENFYEKQIITGAGRNGTFPVYLPISHITLVLTSGRIYNVPSRPTCPHTFLN